MKNYYWRKKTKQPIELHNVSSCFLHRKQHILFPAEIATADLVGETK